MQVSLLFRQPGDGFQVGRASHRYKAHEWRQLLHNGARRGAGGSRPAADPRSDLVTHSGGGSVGHQCSVRLTNAGESQALDRSP